MDMLGKGKTCACILGLQQASRAAKGGIGEPQWQSGEDKN